MGPRCTRIGGSCRSVSCRTLVLFKSHTPTSPPHPWIPPPAWGGGEVTMRTYDPADAILYVHLGRPPLPPRGAGPRHFGDIAGSCGYHLPSAGRRIREPEPRDPPG